MGTIYTDALVDLTDDELVVKHYFYPRGTAKRIPLHTIQTLIAYPPLIRYGKGRVGDQSLDRVQGNTLGGAARVEVVLNH